MAKAAKFNNGKTRTVIHGQRGKRQEIPINKTESNTATDKQAMILFTALGCGSILLFALALTWGTSLIVSGFVTPTQWVRIVAGLAIITASVFVVRSLAWLSFFGAIVFAFKTGAWKTQEHLSRKACKWWRMFPGGGTTAATLLVQSLTNRGEFEEAIKTGEEQFNIHGSNAKASQNLAGMYVTVGMACQVIEQPKESIVWNERAITALTASVAELTTKKNWFAKMAGGQAQEWAGSLQQQLALATFNNAGCYMKLMNHRAAKQQFKKALEYANQAPDFAEKRDLIRACSEQLSRLKHV